MKRRLLASLLAAITLLQVFPARAIEPTTQTILPESDFNQIIVQDDTPDLQIPLVLAVIPEQTPKPKPPTVAVAKRYALDRVGKKQFACLLKLFHMESGWRTTAQNKSSGAYGIPQALPGTKMAKAGKDWKTNPVTQVKWGLMYISGRYGSACNALQHHYYNGWY